MEIVVVQPGESLWQIARRYGVTVEQVASANGLADPGRLVPGIALVVPGERRHVVRPGESLWLIARQYGTTPEAVAALNGIPIGGWIYPGQWLRIPQGPRPVIEANAYQTNFGPSGVATTRSVAPYLTYISLFSSRVTGDGDVVPPPAQGVTAAAHEGRAETLLTLTNTTDEGFSPEVAHAFLGNPAAQDRALDEVLDLLRTGGHSGLNVDFEYVNPGDREAYNNFLRQAAPRLHAAGYSLSTALAPKLSATQRGQLYEAHDYPVHGQVCDFVVLMTYEWGWIGGPPLPVAPINEVRKVLDYAVTAIPPQKILMGMPLYGYDWTLPYQPGTRAEPISNVEAVNRAIRQGTTVQYDPVAQSPFYRYWAPDGREHIVWFEDARSVQAKFDTVKAYGLRGVSYWVLGNPFPQNWLLLQDNFEVRKGHRDRA